MGKGNGKVTFISLFAVCFILLYSTVAFYVMEENEKSKKNVLQEKYDEMAIVKQDLETKLKETETLNTELNARLKTQEDTIAAMTQSLDEEKAANCRNILELQSRENEIHGMKMKLENEKAEKNHILRRIAKTKEENVNLKAQLDTLLKTKEDIDKKTKGSTEKQ